MIFRQGAQNREVPRESPKSVLDRLADEHADEAAIEKVVAELPEESDVYRAVVAEGQKLDARQRQIVGVNLLRLRDRVEQKAATQADQVHILAKVERMRSAFSSPEAHPAEPAVPAEDATPPDAGAEAPVTPAPTEQPEQGFWARAGEYWDGISPTTKAVGGGVAAAALAYGVYKFAKWLWGGTKEAAEKTVEKTKAGMGWLWGTVVGGSLLAVAGVAGFLMWNRARDYFNSLASDVRGAITGGVAAAKREVRDAAEQARTEITERSQAAVSAVRDARDRGMQTIDEKKPVIRDALATSAESAAAHTPGVAVFLLAKYLDSDKIADVFTSLKGMKMGEILACYDPVRKQVNPEKLKSLSVVPAGATQEEVTKYEQALQKLVTFCGERGAEARALHNRSKKPEDPTFDDLALEQYVLSLGGGLALAADAVEFSHDLANWKPDLSLFKRIKEGSLSIGRKVRDFKHDRLSHLSSPCGEIEVKDVLQFLIDEDRGVFAQCSVRQVLTEAAHRRTDAQIERLPPEERQRARIRTLVVEICDRALPTGRELLPFFHRTFPDRAWSADTAANEAAVDQYVKEMSVAQALRLFLYWQMIRSQSAEEQVGGIVALQYEVLRFIDKRDAGYFGGLIKPKFKSAVVGLTDDIAGPAFGQALVDVAQVDAAIVSRVCGMLKEPAKRLAYYAGLAALGPVKYLAEWGLGSLEKHPVLTPLIAGGAAYGLLSPVRFAVNAPLKYGWWWYTRKDPGIAATVLKNPFQRFNPVRRAYGLFNRGAHYLARKEAGSLLMQISEAIDQLPDDVLKKRAHKALEHCLRSGAKDVHLREFSQAVDDMSRGRPPALFAELKKRTRTFVFTPGKANARAALGLYARPFREQMANLRFVREMRAAGLGGTMLWGAGLAAQGYAVYDDWREVGRLSQEKKEVRTVGLDVLAEVRQKLEQDKRFQVAPDGRSFVHRESGVVVDLKIAERQLDFGEGAVGSRVNAQIGQAVTSTASFASLLLMGPRLALGPAGLVVIGAELAIRGGIAVWKQEQMRAFIVNSPPWVVAAIGLQRTTGASEGEWLDDASSWMITDVVRWFGITGPWGLKYFVDPGSADRAWQANEKEKAEIHDRALFAIFCRDLRQNAPEILAEIFDGIETPDAMDQFYRDDFHQIILPFLSIALFRRSGLKWDDAKAIDTTTGLGVTPERITMPQIRRAMREASVFALQHVREQRYVKLLSCRQKFADAQLGEQWESMMAQAGSQSAFGQRLRESSLTGREQKTRVQLLLAEMLHRLGSAQGHAQQSLFTVSPSDVPGLPRPLDMRSRTVAFDFIDDPALRLKVNQVHAETLNEEIGEKRQRWNDWDWSFRFAPLQSSTAELKAAFYGAPFCVANMIAGALKEPPLQENSSMFDVLGRSGDAASYDAARSYITEGLDRLCLLASVQHAAPRRAASYDTLYGENGPLVFVRGSAHPHRGLARLIRHPKVEAPGFETGRLQAVLIEGQKIGGNHDGVLATYIFGDLESGKVSILQRGAGTFMLAGMTQPGFIDGMDRPLTLQEFLVRPGAAKLLEEAKKSLTERKAKAAEEEQQRAQQTEQAQRTASDAWQQGAPKRAESIAAQTQLRAAALARIHTGMIGYVPGEYKVDDQRHRLELANGSFHGRFGDTDITIGDISAADTASSTHSEFEPTPFSFRAQRGDKSWNFHVTMDHLRNEPTPDFSKEDQELARDVLITPMNIAGHPRAGDSQFVERVRQEELSRVLDMARYRGGNGWTGREYRTHLSQELWPAYRDARQPTVFLNALLNNLLQEGTITGGAFDSPYRRILKNMKHEW